MRFSGKRITAKHAATAIIVLSVLVFSGNGLAASTPSGAVSTPAHVAPGHAPSYLGPVNGFLSGPFPVTPVLNGPLTPAHASASQVNKAYQMIAKLELSRTLAGMGTVSAGAATLPPTISCSPQARGCDTITATAGGATSDPNGVSAVNLLGSYGVTVEPPDQSICVGAGHVMQIENLGQLRVWNLNFGGGSAVITLDSLMGLTALGWSSGGDIQCLYDPSNGGHWFITEFVSTTSEIIGGTFAGCFAGVFDACREGIAVSVTNDPAGAYNIYFLDPNLVNKDPGAGYLLNDFAKMGATRDAWLISYDEFNLNGALVPSCPAYGCFGFNGAQQFAFSKTALELGYPTSEPFGGADPLFNVAYENMGLDPTIQPPDGGQCGVTAAFVCWYQVIPAQTPEAPQFDNSWGGSGFMVGSLDFFGAGDTRMAVFDWTGLSNLNSFECSTCSGIHFGGQLLTTIGYLDEGANCMASTGGFCGLAAQKAGPIPLGDNCAVAPYYLNSSPVASCPENGIATNGDGVTQVSYAGGQIWTGISTLIVQKFGKGSCADGGSAECEIHVGAAYFVFGTATFDASGVFSLTDQGYLSPAHEDLEFPAIAASGEEGFPAAVITFTLSGNGGPTGADKGGYFPSTAFSKLTLGSHGAVGSVIYIADKGKAPQDGFTEYSGYPAGTRPRWGDYNAAIYFPGDGGRFYFATEFIQHPNCSDSTFLVDPTCGGTRAPFGNWGDSLNWVG